jgi:hypothetical protein
MPAFQLPTDRKDLDQFVNALTDEILVLYPERDTPHNIFYARDGVRNALKDGADPDDLLRAARNYRAECEREMSPPKFRIGVQRFYTDKLYRLYVAVTVYGRTRDEWARSGQDVAEFDRLAGLTS